MERSDNGGERASRRDQDESKKRHRSRSRSRERDRSHYSRRRERSRSRERDRYSTRSRSRDRDRNTSRYRDRSRSQERRRERDEKQSSRSKHDDHRYDQEERSRSWDHRNRRSRDGHSREYSPEEEPSPVLMLRNLKEEVRKEDISRAIGAEMSYVKDIRLVQRGWKEQGNQGFAFLEFYEPKDASRWLGEHKNNFQILGGVVDIDFSRHKQIGERKSIHEDRDWSCFKCGTLNFARRRVCMTCDCPRGESESLHADVREGRLTSSSDDRRFDFDREDKNPPSNVLILRGMDALSDENSVRSAIGNISGLPLKDVRLIRDKATNTSRGFCFVELNSVDEAKQLLEAIQSQYPAFFVDGRRLIVNFARQMNASGGKTVSSSVASAAIAQAQWSMQTLAMMKSGAIQSQAVTQPQVNQTSVPQANQQGGNVTPQVQATSRLGQTATSAAVGHPNSSGNQTQQQLPSTYSYDPTSGFYYDSSTGLYYDPKTQYHYNSQTGHYCYYEPQQQAYISVDQHGNTIPESSSTATTSTTPTATTSADASTTTNKGKKNVVTSSTSSAKKIAKDMERWAKSVNAAKAVQQQQLQAAIKAEAQLALSAPTVVSSDHSLGQAMPEVSARSGIALTAALKESEDERPSLAAHAADVAEPVSSHFPGPAGADVNPAHTDWNQLVCLLCKRKFPSREVLIKHQQFSDLHKQNLEKEKAQADQLSEIKYRDRAKERRDKYGSPAIVPGWKKRLEREIASDTDREPPIPYEQPTVEGLKDDNIGNKMLQAMGWSEGQGLGRANQGIVEPIKAEQRQVGAGLGAPGSKFLYSSAGTYRDTLKQLTRARYDGTFN